MRHVETRKSPARTRILMMTSAVALMAASAAINTPAFRDGQWALCNCSGWPDNTSFQRLGVWSWTKDDDRRLIVINLSDGAVQARVLLPWDEVRGKTWRLDDALSDASYERDGDEINNNGLYIDLAPWAGQILAFHAIGNPSEH